MQFNNIEEFLAMGGYALFVWSGTGVSLLAMLLLVGFTRWQRRQLFAQIRRKQRRQERIQAARKLENTL